MIVAFVSRFFSPYSFAHVALPNVVLFVERPMCGFFPVFWKYGVVAGVFLVLMIDPWL